MTPQGISSDRWLDGIAVASPCEESWESMSGDDRARACERCELNVYNLSGMSREEAEALVGKTDGRVCVRFYRRPDGTVLTKDCPTGLAAVRRKMALVASTVVGVLAAAIGWAVAAVGGEGHDGRWNPGGGWTAELPGPIGKVFKPFDAPEPPVIMMGIVCAPTPPVVAPTPPVVPTGDESDEE